MSVCVYTCLLYTSSAQNAGEPAIPEKIYPLGGLGEVGKNITLYECQGDMLLVDCGLVFPDSDMYGIDLVIPDFTFVLQNKDRIKGVVITHGHEDHIGSLPYLLREFNVPVYATRLTLGLIKNKLEEHGLASSAKLHEIEPRRKIKLGCFTVEPIHVNHSIPDAVAFAIECPAGVVIHTGDFKVDYTPISDGPTDLTTIAEYGKDVYKRQAASTVGRAYSGLQSVCSLLQPFCIKEWKTADFNLHFAAPCGQASSFPIRIHRIV